MELEISSTAGSDNDKINNRHKVFEFDDKINYSDLSGQGSVYEKYQSNDCNQLQIVFVFGLLQQKHLDDT